MIPRRVWLAVLLAFLFHGLLIITARYRLSYDAYIHMFFGDHYAKDWWSLWDPRWYTGFFVSSYPPLVHQLIGLLSRLAGLDAAFALILWTTLTLYPFAVYVFSRVFVGKTISSYASLGAAFLPSLYLSAHIFGQLPFLFSTLFALFGAAGLARYLKEGGLHNLALTVALASTAMASHHATLLVQPFLVFAVTAKILFHRTQAEAGGSPKKFFVISAAQRLTLTRLLAFVIFAAVFDLLVIFPFWQWGLTQTIQTPIDHLSRHNFIEDPLAIVLFFLPMYGPLALVIPFAFTRNRRLIGLTFAFVLLFLLGLGGTTPLPRLLFGKGWEWLTYDRFAVWASLALLPFFGIAVLNLRRKISPIVIFSALGVTSLIVGFVTVFVPLQPGQVNMQQVVDFLARDDRARYRYLTFGFGDQLALLSTLTTAATIDGSYHTARTLPELRSSGIAQIDTALWSAKGLSALDPILQKAGGHGVRWGFVNVPQYIPVLERNGWVQIGTLAGGVQVWENPGAVLPVPSQPPPTSPLASFAWGTFPLLSLLVACLLGALRLYPVRAEKILQRIYSVLIGLIPLSLCFWYYLMRVEIPHDRVYFTYTDALFFLSDGLALVAVLLWLCLRISRRSSNEAYRDQRHFILHPFDFAQGKPSPFILLLFVFCLLALLSILWSHVRLTSFYVSIHLWLVFLLILSLREQPQAWKPAMLGFCAALSIEAITGLVEFIHQSTSFLDPLGLNWPGPLNPTVPGASVVHLSDGELFLRAYGTLPHPNILGGFTLVLLLGPTVLFLRRERLNLLALLLAAFGVSLLALTFSRSAWLAWIAFALILIWKSKTFHRKHLAFLLIVCALSAVFTLLPYLRLVQARTTDITTTSEEFSFVGRVWLGGEALQMIRERPLTGVGIGAFIVELSQRAGEGYIVEPVHNILLLAGAELGLPGALIVIVFASVFAYRLFKAKDPNVILAGAVIVGIGIISLLDHYFWTLAPGRLMLGLVLGLFLGQSEQPDVETPR